MPNLPEKRCKECGQFGVPLREMWKAGDGYICEECDLWFAIYLYDQDAVAAADDWWLEHGNSIRRYRN